MTLEEYNTYCASLTATTHVVQWGGAHVWKVGGKVFAIAGWSKSEDFAVTFKVSELGYEILKEQPGLRPAPYLASRGLKWIQHYAEPGLDDNGLQDYITESHRIVASSLTKKRQRELGVGTAD